MRRKWPVILALACSDPLGKGPDDPDDPDEQPEEQPEPDRIDGMVECAPHTLDFELSSMLSACDDPDCDTLGGPWRGDGPPALYFDLRMSARCFLAGVAALKKGVTRYTLTDCTGEQVPRDGNLVLTWQPSQPLPLPLTIGQIIDLRYRTIGDDRAAADHHGWSVSDDAGILRAYHSVQSFVPDPWLVEPLELEVSHQGCTPLAQCGGTAFRDQITIRTTGQTVDVPDGNNDTFVNGNTVYDVFVFEARSGSGLACGATGTTARYELAFLAR
jgi:hypothetical protein